MPAADTDALQPSALRDADHLTAIIDLNERLFFAPDLPAVVSILRAAARRLTGADGVTIVLRDGELFIVKTLADHLGHPIVVTSRPGAGTTISVALPLAGSVASSIGG